MKCALKVIEDGANCPLCRMRISSVLTYSSSRLCFVCEDGEAEAALIHDDEDKTRHEVCECACMWVWVYVCVRVRERESARAREWEKERIFLSSYVTSRKVYSHL